MVTHLHALRPRSTEDDLADRRRLVVHVAELRVEAIVVERVRADEADLLLRREQELDPRMRTVLREHAPDAFQHRDDGRLVVRAEDRAAGVAHDAVLDDGVEGPGRRHGVEMGTEEEGRPVRGRVDPGVDVPHRRADFGAAAVLVRPQPEVGEIAQHRVGHPALFPWRAGNRHKLQKQR